MAISLSSYLIRIKNKESGMYAQLDSFDGKSDLLGELRYYFSTLSTKSSHDKKHKKIMSTHNITAFGRLLNGIVETGEYGYESTLKNKDTGAISHKRTTDEAEMLPFYVLIKIPKNVHEGILILQRFKQFGIRKYLLNDFNNYIAIKYPSFAVEIEPLVPDTLIQQYLNEGFIFKIRFISYKIHKDITDKYYSQGEKELPGYEEYVISAKRNGKLPFLEIVRAHINNYPNSNKLIELSNFNYDNTKIDMVVNKKHRIINLGNQQKIRANYDITDQVKINIDGHPLFDSIDAIGMDLLDDLSEMIYGKTNAR